MAECLAERHAGRVFVADDLAAWLIGLLADAGRKKLTSLILGTDQERALRQATTSAVQRTADELRPGDDEQAEHLALVISQVFSEPTPSSATGRATLLEALQGGIDRQLAVLDDATLTGTGQSSANMLGVAGMVVAQKLTGHLVQEIVARGARGGPLAPLADQLNHDVTHLQGQRLEGMLGQLAGEVRQTLARLGSSPAVTTGEEPARPANTISGGTFFGPVLQGRDIRADISPEQGSRRQAEPNHPSDAEMPARALQSRPAFTGRWLQTADGFAASPLMNIVNTSMPGYTGTHEQVPFVRIGACVASDPVPPDASSGRMGDRFIALLSRDPVAGFISRLTYVGDKVAWARHAGNGILRLDAVMSSGDEHERPTASAMLLAPVTGMRNYGRADGAACLWLHVEPRAQDGSPQAFSLPQWHGHLCRAVDTAAALAAYLADDLGLHTRDDPSVRVGVLLQVPATMSDLVDTGHLAPLPGAVRSTQFLGYVIANPIGKPADEAVLDLLRQLCDHTLHLGGDFERTLEAIPRLERLTQMPGT